MVKRFNEQGNVGKPEKFSARDKRLIKWLSSRSRFSSFSEISQQFYEQIGRTISKVWIRKNLSCFSLKRYVELQKSLLNLNQRRKRKEWAIMRSWLTVRNGWDSFLFSDENIFKWESIQNQPMAISGLKPIDISY